MTNPHASSEERLRRLMMGALDDELSRQEHAELSRALKSNPALATEWKQLQRVKEVTRGMALEHPPREVWDDYWTGVYRRLERGIGWILLSIGAIILISWGAWQGIMDLLDDATMPIVVKLGVLALVIGLVVLFVSVIREKLTVRQRDPYKDVER